MRGELNVLDLHRVNVRDKVHTAVSAQELFRILVMDEPINKRCGRERVDSSDAVRHEELQEPAAPKQAAPKQAAAEQAGAEAPAVKPNVEFDQFKALDLRVGTVKVAEKHPNADRILRLEIDFGEGELRQILSGLAEHYAPED